MPNLPESLSPEAQEQWKQAELAIEEGMKRIHALAGPRLTVQEIDNLPENRENYIYECSSGEIQLDGYFTRAQLLQLAMSIPSTSKPNNA